MKERTLQKDMRIVTSSLQNFESLAAQNIINLYLYLIRNAIKLSYCEVIHLKVQHIRDFLGYKASKLTNSQIEQLLNNLAEKTMTIDFFKTIHNEEDELINNPTKRDHIPFFSKISIEDKKNIQLTVNKEIMEYAIYKEGNKYVPIFLSITQDARSKYTPKLFEFISSFRTFSSDATNNNIKISLKMLRATLHIKGKYSFADIDRYILKPAQQECKGFGLAFSYMRIKGRKETGDSRKVVGIEICMTNEDKKKFQMKINKSKPNDLNEKKFSEDKILQYVREKAKQYTVEWLRKELLHQKKFEPHIRSIESGKKYGTYIFVYKNKKTNDGKDVYKIISFYQLDTIVKYFTRMDGESLENEKLIQDILNERRD